MQVHCKFLHSSQWIFCSILSSNLLNILYLNLWHILPQKFNCQCMQNGSSVKLSEPWHDYVLVVSILLSHSSTSSCAINPVSGNLYMSSLTSWSKNSLPVTFFPVEVHVFDNKWHELCPWCKHQCCLSAPSFDRWVWFLLNFCRHTSWTNLTWVTSFHLSVCVTCLWTKKIKYVTLTWPPIPCASLQTLLKICSMFYDILDLSSIDKALTATHNSINLIGQE